jgi:hypothetical protein
MQNWSSPRATRRHSVNSLPTSRQPVDVGIKDQVVALGNAAMQRFGCIDTWVDTVKTA